MSNNCFKCSKSDRTGSSILLAAALASAAIITGGCLFNRNPASGPGSGTSMSSTVMLQELIDSVMTAVEEIRDLEFKREVAGKALSKKEWAEYVDRIFSSDVQDYYGNNFDTELYQLGFVDNRGFSYTDEYRYSYEQSVAGFYVAGTDSFYAVGYDSIPASGWRRENLAFIISHELTHALQDQHFDAFNDSISSSIHTSWAQTDFYSAFQHVYEGDAELSCMLYYFGYQEAVLEPVATTLQFFSNLKQKHLDIQAVIIDSLFEEPFFISYTSYSPYNIGADYVGNYYKQAGNWSTINELFKRRDFTMAEIITGNAVSVKRFPAEQLRSILNLQQSDYWDDDNLGALWLIALCANEISTADAGRALGWQGDHLLYAKQNADSLGSFVWVMAFADSASALRMHGILDKHVQSRFGAAGLLYSTSSIEWAPDSSYLTFNYEKPDLKTQLVLHKNEIYWLENVGSLADSIVGVCVSPPAPPLAKAAYPYPRRKKVRRFPRSVVRRFPF
jgi:hypothetical protein